MSGRQQTFKKTQKEQRRKEKRQEKLARRLERKGQDSVTMSDEDRLATTAQAEPLSGAGTRE
jgi:hypothetical protein